MRVGGSDQWLPCEVLFKGSRHTIIKVSGGREYSHKTSKLKIRDIDLRTDEEKAIDYMNYAYSKGHSMADVLSEIKKDYVLGVKYTGK